MPWRTKPIGTTVPLALNCVAERGAQVAAAVSTAVVEIVSSPTWTATPGRALRAAGQQQAGEGHGTQRGHGRHQAGLAHGVTPWSVDWADTGLGGLGGSITSSITPRAHSSRAMPAIGLPATTAVCGRGTRIVLTGALTIALG